MSMFKKLHENSVYWKFRHVTRRQLALKHWWRELRNRSGGPRVSRVSRGPYRATAAFNPYARGAGLADQRRGFVFVLVLAAAWTALSVANLPQNGLPMGLARIAVLAAITTVFVRFWA